jgi:hypothetical protein
MPLPEPPKPKPEHCVHPHVRVVRRWHGKIGAHHMFLCQECGRYLRPVFLEVDPVGRLIQRIDQAPEEQSEQRQAPAPAGETGTSKPCIL